MLNEPNNIHAEIHAEIKQKGRNPKHLKWIHGHKIIAKYQIKEEEIEMSNKNKTKVHIFVKNGKQLSAKVNSNTW